MDLRLPGISGVEAIKTLVSRHRGAKFVVLTTYEGDEDIHQALEAGARSYIIKGMPHEALVSALRRVQAGGRFLPTPVTQALSSRLPNSELSAREREVLTLIAGGKSNKEIATELGITESTVKCHVSVILMRLNVSDRTQAVVSAIQRGLVHVIGSISVSIIKYVTVFPDGITRFSHLADQLLTPTCARTKRSFR